MTEQDETRKGMAAIQEYILQVAESVGFGHAPIGFACGEGDLRNDLYALKVVQGKKWQLLKFRTSDIEDWPGSPSITQKYAADILLALSLLKKPSES
jgi:hypothetical protein